MKNEIQEYLSKMRDSNIEKYNSILIRDKDSILSSSLKEHYQHMKDFFEIYNIELNKTYFIEAAILTYRMIILIEEKEKKSISKKNFKNTINEMNSILDTLNIYESNQGYTKMKKRNELLLKQFDKYLNEEILKESIENFFTDITCIKLPTVNNIISLFQQNIKTLMKDTLSISNQEREEAVLNLSRNLFNKINFTKDLKYKKIILGENTLKYEYEGEIQIKKEEIFILIKP